MAYSPVTPTMGIQPIGFVSTVQNHPLGFIVQAVDPVFGGGEFVYLAGFGTPTGGPPPTNNLVGTMVTYDSQHVAALPSGAGVGAGSSVAFLTSQMFAGQFGWGQIGGIVGTALKATGAGVTATSPVYAATAGNAGQVSGAAVAGRQVLSCQSTNTATVAAAATAVPLMISRPCLQSQIT